MPIATCVISPDCLQKADDPIALWAEATGLSAEQMTLNFIDSAAQWGQPYAVMATLYLPTLWTAERVVLIQEGLAQALAHYFDVSLDEVHIVTQTVTSGHVVDAGKTLIWPENGDK